MDIGYLRQSFSGDQVARLFSDNMQREALLTHYYPDIERRIKTFLDDEDWCETVAAAGDSNCTTVLHNQTRWAFACLTHLFGHQMVNRYLQEYPREFIGAGVIASTDGNLFIAKKSRHAMAEWIGTFTCYYALHRHESIVGYEADPDLALIVNIAQAFLNREIQSVQLRRRAFQFATTHVFATIVNMEAENPPETPHTCH